MKRWIMGLSCAVGATVVATADDAPAARLGSPLATLGSPIVARGQMPEVKDKDKDAKTASPMPMPKAAVGESSTPKTTDTKTLPGAPTPYGPVMTPGTSGPMLTGPIVGGTPMPGTVMPGNPMLSGPVVMSPTPIPGIVSTGPDCGSPFGCPIPTAGGISPSRWYASGEFLFWWMKGFTAPPLVTVSPPASNATIGNPGTTVLYPPDSIDANPRYGARFSLGYHLSPKWAIEGDFFFLGRKGESFSLASGDVPDSALGRPFVSNNTGQNTAELVGFPNVYQGFVAVNSRSQMLGFEFNAIRNYWSTCNSRLDFIFGYRFVDLTESLTIEERVRSLPGAAQFGIRPGIDASIIDTFRTSNQFHGGQIGVAYERTWGRWVLDAKAKVALGVVHQSLDVDGATALLSGGAVNNPGGLLALRSNLGHTDVNRFAVVPEVSLNLGYNITDHIRIFAGYNFLYMSNVARPGGSIDKRLDERSIPNFLANPLSVPNAPGRPLAGLSKEDLWVQGVNFGLLFRW